jgi:hypothetical protein
MAEIIQGPVRNWLDQHRDELNGRFRQARRRYPQLDADATLELLRDILPPLAAPSHPASSALLNAVYDLILLHAGRGTLAPAGGTVPGIRTLLRETFPKIQRLLLNRTGDLPGALSNAVENVGDAGCQFASDIGQMAEHVSSATELLDAGVVMAWRLGEARLREPALELLSRLPHRVSLLALGLGNWPDAAAPLLANSLCADAWRRYDTILDPATRDAISSLGSKRFAELTNRLSSVADAPLSTWTTVHRVGNFSGFGGHFDEPPVLLSSGRSERHRFWARSGSQSFQIDADQFGWTCRAVCVDFPVASPSERRGLAAMFFGDKAKREHQRLRADGTVEWRGETARIPLLAGASYILATDNCFAFTRPDSFRIRILLPTWQPI